MNDKDHPATEHQACPACDGAGNVKGVNCVPCGSTGRALLSSKTMSHADALRRLRAINEWLSKAGPANEHGVWLDYVDDAFMDAWDHADTYDLESPGETPPESHARRLLRLAWGVCENEGRKELAAEIDAYLRTTHETPAPASIDDLESLLNDLGDLQAHFVETDFIRRADLIGQAIGAMTRMRRGLEAAYKMWSLHQNERGVADRMADTLNGALQGVSVETSAGYDRQAALAKFAEYVWDNYPANTIISDPTWHAPRLFRAAEYAMRAEKTNEVPCVVCNGKPPSDTCCTGCGEKTEEHHCGECFETHHPNTCPSRPRDSDMKTEAPLTLSPDGLEVGQWKLGWPDCDRCECGCCLPAPGYPCGTCGKINAENGNGDV